MTYLYYSLVSFIFLFVFPMVGIAQTKIGFMAGTQQTSLKGDKYFSIPDSTRPRFSTVQGFRFAAFYAIKLNKFFSIRPEIAYSQKGGYQKLDSGYLEYSVPPGWKDVYNTTSTFRLNYIELPIVAKFSALLFKYGKGEEKKQVAFEIFAGGHVSYLIGSSYESAVTTRRSSADTSTMYNFTTTQVQKGRIPNTKINRWDAGLVAGLAIKTKLTKLIDIYAEARYTNSYVNINNGQWDRKMTDPNDWFSTVSINPTIVNRDLVTFSVGLILNFGKEGFHFTPAE